MLVGRLKKAAENLDISCQWENGCGRTCTDADAIHVAGRGIPTTVLSIPLRYMHNPAEVCSMSDVQACIDVLAEFLCSIGPDICLKPLEARGCYEEIHGNCRTDRSHGHLGRWIRSQ